MKQARWDIIKSMLESEASRGVLRKELSETDIIDVFNEWVFTEDKLRVALPTATYNRLQELFEDSNAHLDEDLAEVVANAIKNWAIAKGATHFTHWFQPLNGTTAEKHESFLQLDRSQNCRPIMDFSGSQLVKGKNDASSLPSGGLRTTFEARGYTAWDPSTPAFIRPGPGGSTTLYVPTAFCSWTGEALDKKTPLIRSIEALNRESLSLLKLTGDAESERVIPHLGIEQEFFLIDRGYFLSRPDLLACGRTLVGALPPKGQELEDHYFGTIHPRVLAVLQEAEMELWKLGVPAVVRHNEVAPGQYEIAPVYESAVLANDHNLLTMEILRDAGARYGMICLLHEKPFASINGSGKHLNYGLFNSQHRNLLDPGPRPASNLTFLLYLAAVMRAVDIHADLLRWSIATSGNDLRLGCDEAPPTIMSIHVGNDLEALIMQVISAVADTDEEDVTYKEFLNLGETIPALPRDTTDRNRTSPLAFTGTKFEFRCLGSSQSAATPTIVLNTMIAESLQYMRFEIEALLNKPGSKRFSAREKAMLVVRDTFRKHHRIIFNGNNYSAEWHEEAIRRGLPFYPLTSDCLELATAEKNLDMFLKMGVHSPAEVRSRVHVMRQMWIKKGLIEGECIANIARTMVIPTGQRHCGEMAKNVNAVREALTTNNLEILMPQLALLKACSEKVSALVAEVQGLDAALRDVEGVEDDADKVIFVQEMIYPKIHEVRQICDWLEMHVTDSEWPIAKYQEILFIR
eukprot:Clim_evm45s11 gene=Clim_evmTU45s11